MKKRKAESNATKVLLRIILFIQVLFLLIGLAMFKGIMRNTYAIKDIKIQEYIPDYTAKGRVLTEKDQLFYDKKTNKWTERKA